MHVSRTISVAICGMSKSGKTALTARLRSKEFVEQYMPTHGTDLSVHYNIPDKLSPGAFIRFQIQDFSGDKQFSDTTNIFLAGRTAIYFVVDPMLSLDQQFKKFEELLSRTSPETALFLVQTKADLQTESNKVEVAARLQEFIKQQAESHKMFSLYVTSSKAENDTGRTKLLEATLYGPNRLTLQPTQTSRNSTDTLFKEIFVRPGFANIRVGETKSEVDDKLEERTASSLGLR